ncbi:MAG TPA: ADOP family duplicated permease [Bryobacteraceae bacterium]|jgi:predicted permease|nr:ADOP family duplicated permease [Bryobacteraceae bacterium]
MFLPETLLQDLQYGSRILYRNIRTTALSVLALALGIGVNTAVFTAYEAMVTRSLDARNPREMVNLALVRSSGAIDFSFSYPDYEAYRSSVHSLNDLIAFRPEHLRLMATGGIVTQQSNAGAGEGTQGLLSSKGTNSEFASVFVVSENYFKVLGVAPLRGRTFDSIAIADLLAAPSVLISENYWQKRFGGDPAILGKSVRLNGSSMTLIGITPHDFVGTGIAVPDFWLPVSLEPLVHAEENWLRDRENQCCRLFGRLASGSTVNRVQAEVAVVANHLRALHDPHSDSAKPVSALVWPGSPFPRPLSSYAGLHLAILLIMAAAGMVLVVACANVASLQLARARSRQNELHTRLSLGANRLRLVKQLLTESALLGLLAGAVALLFTWALLKISVTMAVEAVPADKGTLIFDVTPDLRIFAYVVAVSLVAGILFGLAPALESSRSALSSSERGSTSPVGRRRLQDFLITAQVCLSLVLMIAASLFVRGAIHSIRTDTGYDSKHVIDLDLQFPEESKYTSDHKTALLRELRRRLSALPGVVAVTGARAPDDNLYRTAAVALSGANGSSHNLQSILYYTYVEANYFQTLGIPFFLGHGFQPQTHNAGQSVILSESAAKQLWPRENPIGRSVRLGATDEKLHVGNELIADGPAYQVIGIVRDTRGVEFDGSDSKEIYLLSSEDQLQNRPTLIRTEADPAQVIRAMDPMISSVDPGLGASVSTLNQMLRQAASFITSSIAAAVASTAGIFGLLLALMGIYGTVSYIVALRTREIGIRVAVGAQSRDILVLILRESTRPVLVGLLAGIFLALGACYLLRGLLYGLNGADSISFLGVSLLFLAIALLAAYPPSRQAMRVDPTEALRYE